MEFSLTIVLGNDTMRTGYDVAQALREVAARLQFEADADNDIEAANLDEETQGRIRDDNGNTVGSYQVLES